MKLQNALAMSFPKRIRHWLNTHPDVVWQSVFAVAILLVFGRGLFAKDCLSDDMLYVGKPELLRLTWTNICYWWQTPILGLRSPLVMYSFMLDRLVWDENLLFQGCHLQNLCWHFLCCVVFYKLARMLKFRRADGSELCLPRAYAGFLVLLWALHPQRVESVVWVAERKDGLSTFLGLSALVLFVRPAGKKKSAGRARYWCCYHCS